MNCDSDDEIEQLFSEYKKQNPNAVIDVVQSYQDEMDLDIQFTEDSEPPVDEPVAEESPSAKDPAAKESESEKPEATESGSVEPEAEESASEKPVAEERARDNLRYIDSNSEEEITPDDPDYIFTEEEDEEEHLQDNITEDNALGKIKRKRRKTAAPQEWKDNKNKKLREEGKIYEGWTKKKRGTVREERKIGEPCRSKFCLKSKIRQCQEVTEEDRNSLFKTFWETLSWDQKKIYIMSLVKSSTKQTTKKKPGEESRRQKTVTYTLKLPNGNIMQVCKKLFLSTFALGEWTVLNWISDSHGMAPCKEVVVKQRRQSNPRKQTKNVDGKEFLKTFLDSLPKLPSHYCRRKSSKIYLEPIYGDNMLALFNEYKRLCCENETGPVQHVSRCTFDKYVSELNLSFQQPKKDRCDKCIMYEAGNMTEQDYQKHVAKKERARKEKTEDTEKAEAGTCTVLTMDVQAVKVCPSLNASALYYKTKLCCHNFTIYDLKTHTSKCYWFNETQSDLTANTFASCIIDYLSNHCDLSKPVVLWSDGCTAQNRNSILSNALLAFSTEKNVQIEQKFLVKGHTQMEVDSVHSLIERKIKNKKIYLPSDFLRLTEEARVSPSPLQVKELSLDFAKNYGAKGLLVYDSIRPGKKSGDPKVTNLRSIKYHEGKIEIKTSFDDGYKDLPQRPRRCPPTLSSFPQLFLSPLTIPKRKWQDLQDLKSVIPADCHLFYDSLPHD